MVSAAKLFEDSKLLDLKAAEAPPRVVVADPLNRVIGGKIVPSRAMSRLPSITSSKESWLKEGIWR